MGEATSEMEEIKLQSHIIDSISYYERIMFVKLKDGKMFSYNAVPNTNPLLKSLLKNQAKTHICDVFA